MFDVCTNALIITTEIIMKLEKTWSAHLVVQPFYTDVFLPWNLIYQVFLFFFLIIIIYTGFRSLSSRDHLTGFLQYCFFVLLQIDHHSLKGN